MTPSTTLPRYTPHLRLDRPSRSPPDRDPPLVAGPSDRGHRSRRERRRRYGDLAPRARPDRGARSASQCVIGGTVYIDEGVTLGDRVKIQSGALVYHGVTVEDGVFIGPGAILTNDRFPRAITAEGELASADDWKVSPIHLGHGCSIGAGAIVVAGCDVGPFALVGAGAVVTRTVPGLRAGGRQSGPADRLGLRLRSTARRCARPRRAGRPRSLRHRS